MSKHRTIEIKITVMYDPVAKKMAVVTDAPCQDLMDLFFAAQALEHSLIDLVSNLESGEYTEQEIKNGEGVKLRGKSAGTKNAEIARQEIANQFKNPSKN